MDPSSNVDVADPRGWLKIVPQLYRFCSDPKIREAVELGDGAKLHKALSAAKKNPMFLNDRTTIDEIQNIRRLFVHGSGAPSLFTLNGFGTKIYGKSDEGSDGTYVTTLFFTALFIPVIPIKQYLVRHEGGNRYAFFGTVPSSPAIKAWQWVTLGGPAALFVLVLLAGMVGAATGAGGSTGGGSSGSGSIGSYFGGQTVYLTNGLDVPLKVVLKDEKDPAKNKSWKVESNSHTSADLPTGKVDLAITSVDDVELSHEEVTIPSGSFVAYNIYASAPVYAEGAIYTKYAPPKGQEEKEEYHYFTGQTLITYSGIEYPFSDPPKSVSMGEDSTKQTIWYTGIEKGGWLSTIFLLEKDKKSDEAEKLAEAVILAEPEDHVAQTFARYYVKKYKGTEGAAELGSKMVELWPNSLEAHRFYQDYAQLAGKESEMLAKYKDMYEKEKGPWTGYLYARIAPAGEGAALLEELTQKYPKEAYLHRSYGWMLLNGGKYEDALSEMEESLRLDPEHHTDMLGYHAKALVALGKTDEAAKLIEEQEDGKKTPTFQNALLYGQIAKAAGGKLAHEGDYYLNLRANDTAKSIDPLADGVWYDMVVTGKAVTTKELDTIESPSKRDAIEVMNAAMKNPKEALQIARELPTDSLEQVDPGMLTMLALEFERTGDAKDADRIFKAMPELARHHEEMKAFVKTGKGSAELRDIDLEAQAAMKIVRARAMPKSDKKRIALINEAKSQDVMKGLITHAALAWSN
ncbi:MAG: tetratricopeptide repeat protein [Myxococcaceae bacterium]